MTYNEYIMRANRLVIQTLQNDFNELLQLNNTICDIEQWSKDQVEFFRKHSLDVRDCGEYLNNYSAAIEEKLSLLQVTTKPDYMYVLDIDTSLSHHKTFEGAVKQFDMNIHTKSEVTKISDDDMFMEETWELLGKLNEDTRFEQTLVGTITKYELHQ